MSGDSPGCGTKRRLRRSSGHLIADESASHRQAATVRRKSRPFIPPTAFPGGPALLQRGHIIEAAFGGLVHNLACAARFALVFFCALVMGTPANAKPLQCAPFAREASGIEIRGNAYSWWAQAEGRYARGNTPKVGAVLAFAATPRMRNGHVAMVSRIVSEREVLLTHANWSYRGGIERDVRAIDVSPAGDWSQVRVWYGPMRDLGLTAYPAHGFIYAEGAGTAEPAERLVNARGFVSGPSDPRGISTLVAAD